VSKAKKKRARPNPGEPKKTRWELSAERENARRQKKAPLFFHAGLVPRATPEEREARFGDEFRARIEREDLERRQKEADAEDNAREQVRNLVTPEQFTELEEKRSDDRPNYWRLVLHRIHEARAPKAPTEFQASLAPLEARTRADVRRRLPLFVELPSGDVVPAVVDGKAIPIEQIAAEHGLDTDHPELVVPESCPGCGWKPGPGDGVRFNFHDPNCAHFRAFLLGLSENCADCKAIHRKYAGAPYGVCPAHLERTLACQQEGCIPGPPPREYLASCGEFCQRCGVSMRAEPYRAPEAA